jgi:hypothetical protein
MNMNAAIVGIVSFFFDRFLNVQKMLSARNVNLKRQNRSFQPLPQRLPGAVALIPDSREDNSFPSSGILFLQSNTFRIHNLQKIITCRNGQDAAIEDSMTPHVLIGNDTGLSMSPVTYQFSKRGSSSIVSKNLSIAYSS